jgi:hypothetical protein
LPPDALLDHLTVSEPFVDAGASSAQA